MYNIANNVSFHFHKTLTVFMKNCESYQVSCKYYTFSTIYITVCCECRFSQFLYAFTILTTLSSKIYRSHWKCSDKICMFLSRVNLYLISVCIRFAVRVYHYKRHCYIRSLFYNCESVLQL